VTKSIHYLQLLGLALQVYTLISCFFEVRNPFTPTQIRSLFIIMILTASAIVAMTFSGNSTVRTLGSLLWNASAIWFLTVAYAHFQKKAVDLKKARVQRK
jgi:hypothetical protein